MAQWKKDLKRAEKSMERREEKEGRKLEVEKFKMAEEKIEKEKNRGKVTRAIKKGENAIKSIVDGKKKGRK